MIYHETTGYDEDDQDHPVSSHEDIQPIDHSTAVRESCEDAAIAAYINAVRPRHSMDVDEQEAVSQAAQAAVKRYRSLTRGQ